MQSIEALIQQATDAPVGTIVHVGAGRGAVLEQYGRLAPSTVVLVEGDPETAHALQRAARPFPWARVVARAAAATDGELTWNRYNLPSLNGPVVVDALTRSYPRLNREAATSVPGVALSGLLRSALEGGDPDRNAVLVLDVPGQEAALLDSIGADLHRLSGVVVRRCATPLPGAAPWSMVLERMQAWSFELVGHEADGEPLWPVACFRFDQRRQEEVLLRGKVDALRARLAVLEAELDGARQAARSSAFEQAQQLETLAQARTAAESLAAEREVRVRQLIQMHEDLSKQVEVLTQAKAVVERFAADRATQVEALSKAMAEADELLNAKAVALSQLAGERDDLSRQVESLTQAKTVAETVAAELAARVDALAKEAADSMKLAAARAAWLQQAITSGDEKTKQIEVLAKSKEEAEYLASHRASQLEALDKARAEADKLAADRAAALQQMTVTRDDLASQLKSVNESVARWEKVAVERDAQVEALTKGRDEAEKVANERLMQVELLTQARSAAEKRAADAETSLQKATLTLEELAAQVEVLTRTRADAERTEAERSAALQQAIRTRDEQIALAVEQRDLYMQAQVRLAAADKRATELDESLATTRKRLQQLEAELSQAHGTVRLAVLGRTAVEADLSDLQGRYGALVAEQRASREIMTDVLERLEYIRANYAPLVHSSADSSDPTARGGRQVASPRRARRLIAKSQADTRDIPGSDVSQTASASRCKPTA